MKHHLQVSKVIRSLLKVVTSTNKRSDKRRSAIEMSYAKKNYQNTLKKRSIVVKCKKLNKNCQALNFACTLSIIPFPVPLRVVLRRLGTRQRGHNVKVNVKLEITRILFGFLTA